jgi:FkbM family methyltransferase
MILKQLLKKLESLSSIESVRGHSFYSSSININSYIIDLGANKGDFAKYFLDTYGCNIYCVEPNINLLNSTPTNIRNKIDNYVISNQNGKCSFHISQNSEASSIYKNISNKFGNSQAVEVPSITLSSYLEQKNIDIIEILKIDIEGGEIDLLNYLPDRVLNSINQITVEFHDFIFPEQADLVKKIVFYLERKGFFVFKCHHYDNSDILFINQKMMSKQISKNKVPFLFILKFVYLLRRNYHQTLKNLKQVFK